MSRGFTLLETVISISLISVLGAIFASTLTQGLRGQTKATLIAQAKQNGNLVLNALEKDVRSADKIVCVGNNSIPLGCVNTATEYCGDTLVLKKGNTYSRYRFQSLTGGIGTIGLESGITLDNSISDQSYLCTDVTPPREISYLTNINNMNGLSMRSGKFTRKIQPGFNDLLVISFIINSVTGAGQTTESSLIPGGIPFTTAVEVR